MIPASAEIQRPSLVLEQASVYLDSCYVGIPYTQQIMIINRGLLPTKYEWIDKNKVLYYTVVHNTNTSNWKQTKLISYYA